MKVLSGGKLAGGNPKGERVTHDFYATDPKALKMLMEEYQFNEGSFLEPCVGNGNLANIIKDEFPGSEITCIDIVDRGYPNTIIHDFLTWETDEKFDNIITNSPYSIAKEFVEKGLSLLDEGGKMAMFLKVQFLEGMKRQLMFEKYPHKYMYVFTKRMPTWKNGQPKDENGKKWATTMCHAWFIWEKDSKAEPIIRWL